MCSVQAKCRRRVLSVHQPGPAASLQRNAGRGHAQRGNASGAYGLRRLLQRWRSRRGAHPHPGDAPDPGRSRRRTAATDGREALLSARIDALGAQFIAAARRTAAHAHSRYVRQRVGPAVARLFGAARHQTSQDRAARHRARHEPCRLVRHLLRSGREWSLQQRICHSFLIAVFFFLFFYWLHCHIYFLLRKWNWNWSIHFHVHLDSTPIRHHTIIFYIDIFLWNL